MIKAIVTFALLALAAPALAADCAVKFDCPGRTASIGDKRYPIVCARQTGENGDGVLADHVIKASGPWRRGLVAPGTPMIATRPPLCFNCFIHVSGLSHSIGCIGTTTQGFAALKTCLGHKFTIVAGRSK